MKQRGPASLSGKVFDSKSSGPGFEPHWIIWVCRGSVLGQDTSEPQPITRKSRKDMNIVNCHSDMTEILLKAT